MNEETQARLAAFLNHPLTIPSAIGVVAFASGIGVGYIWGQRKKTKEVDTLPSQLELDFDVDATLSEVREQQARKREVVGEISHPSPPDPKPGKVVIDVEDYVKHRLEEELETQMSTSSDEDEPEEQVEIVSQNVFAENDDDWDYEEELKHRKTTEPYILHVDEFYEDEKGYNQMTLTYYEGDEVLVDELDTPIYDFLMLTGPLKFGHGSGDPNAIYIRNDTNRAEYEIIRDQGHYSIEVLGLEMEQEQEAQDLKHSNNRKFNLME